MTSVTVRRTSAGDVLSSLAELLLPRACVGCGQHGTAWCLDCLAVEFDPVLHRPDPCPPGLPVLATSAVYAGSVRCAILAAKERDRRDLDRMLGALLATAAVQAISSDPWRPDRGGRLWLVPVPASPTALRERGRDHVSDWTHCALGYLRRERINARQVPALRRKLDGLDSVGLGAAQRADNLRGAFSLGQVSAPSPGTTIVVVDDIVTTGATLVEASTCLARHFDLRPEWLRAAVVGATARHRAA